MPNYGRIVTHSPQGVASGATLTLNAPPTGQFKFIPGATFVTFKIGSLAQITVIPAGIRYISDYEVSLPFPQLSVGSYQCLIAAGLDLAETTNPIMGGGMSAGVPAGSYGPILAAPAPAQAKPGDAIMIKAPAASPFSFDDAGTFVTFGGTTGAIYQVTVVPSSVTTVDAKTIRLAVPQLPPGSYAVHVASGASTAECAAPQVVVPGGTLLPRLATPLANPMLSMPTGATPTTRITLTAPYGGGPPPASPISLGAGLPPFHTNMEPPSPITKLSQNIGQLFRVLSAPGAKSASAKARGKVESNTAAPPKAPPKSLRDRFRPVGAPAGSPPVPGEAAAASTKTPAKPSWRDRFRPIEPAPTDASPAPLGTVATPPTPAPAGVPPIVATTPAAPISTPAPGYYQPGHAIEYILDGAAYFQHLTDLLDDVAEISGEAGYVHMAFWMCDDQTILDNTSKKLIDKIKALGAAGKEVKLLLWQPPPTAGPQSAFIAGVRRVNDRCKQQIDSLKLTTVEVQLLSHPLPFGSYHQAVVIANVGPYSKVLLGGLNVHSSYKDASPHSGNGWHDLALQLAGPATNGIEAQWEAQWALVQGGPRKGPAAASSRGSQSVFVGVTDPPKLSLRDELVTRIQTANDFVYMENYGIFEPEVITALGHRIRAKRDAGQDFYVLLLVPNQSLGAQYAWLHYVTYCHLSFMNCTSFSFVNGANTVTVSRAADGKSMWAFDYSGSAFGIGNWYENSTVSWDTGSASIRDIRGFQGETLLYSLEHCSGAGIPNPMSHVYVHSKAAIIDDVFAVVGSANFTPRGMRQDGEIAAFIHGDSVAKLRESLWNEHFNGKYPNPAYFWGAVRDNHVARAAGKLIPGQLYVMPLQFTGLQKEPSGTDPWLGADQR